MSAFWFDSCAGFREHASKILSALRNAPEDSVPCVLKRLEFTLEQMRKDKISRSERWAEQTRACLSRSLDSQANFFRNNDQKFLRCRSVIQDIEKAFEAVSGRRRVSVRCRGSSRWTA